MKIKGYKVSDYIEDFDGKIEGDVEDIGDGYSIAKCETGSVLIENCGQDDEIIWKIIKK